MNRIQLTSPSTAITITAGTGNLALGGADVAGIDMGASTQNLTIHAPVILANSQEWSVNTGQTLLL